jgi:hypothetical protein
VDAISSYRLCAEFALGVGRSFEIGIRDHETSASSV